MIRPLRRLINPRPENPLFHCLADEGIIDADAPRGASPGLLKVISNDLGLSIPKDPNAERLGVLVLLDQFHNLLLTVYLLVVHEPVQPFDVEIMPARHAAVHHRGVPDPVHMPRPDVITAEVFLEPRAAAAASV